MTFSEPVVKGTGDITVYQTATDFMIATIGVNTAAVLFEGNVATITLPSNLDPSTGYYVNIAAGAFKDAANNNFAGIADKTTWNFTTGTTDITAPSIVTLSPADDSSNLLPTANLMVTYGENILAGSGSLVIKKSSDNSVVETIPVPGAGVQVSGASATFNPAAVLDYGTSYYVEIAAGTFKDAANNGTAAVSGNATWNFTTRGVPPIVINQYYEGAGSDRYIELKNLTGNPIPLDGYRVAAWSDTAPSDNEGWKSGSGTTDRVTNLAGHTIPANGTFLIAEIAASAPPYAAANKDLTDDGGCTAINGDDSVVLYFSGVNPLAFTLDEVVDAVSLATNDGVDKSFYRLNNGVGFDFSTGTSILNYSSVWGTKTLADVASAAITDDWYLQASNPPSTLTLDITPVTFSEAAGNGAATATVTRNSSTAESLLVIISVQGSKATSQLTADIPATQSSVQFPINAVDDAWLTGNATVTFTVSAAGHVPDSAQVTVTDQETDTAYPVVINEVDADQALADTTEFIELYNKSNAPVSLDGLVLVLFNGGAVNDVSYQTIDLSGKTIPANGFFVVGNTAVTSALVGVGSVTVADDSIQNGADAVALYLGEAAGYPNGTAAASAPGILIDALVYDTSDADDTALIAALTPGKLQLDENANSNAATESISRVPDGGAAFDTALYAVQAPTPGATNVIAPPGNTFATWIGGYNVGGQTGFNDDFDNDGLDNAMENILGSDPSVTSQGLSAVSTSGGNLVFRHTLNATPASDLQASYEWSADLAAWNASGASAGGTTVTFGAPVQINAGPPALVEVTATVTGTPPGKVFARIKVQQN